MYQAIGLPASLHNETDVKSGIRCSHDRGVCGRGKKETALGTM